VAKESKKKIAGDFARATARLAAAAKDAEVLIAQLVMSPSTKDWPMHLLSQMTHLNWELGSAVTDFNDLVKKMGNFSSAV
jgi:hypothetical protein